MPSCADVPSAEGFDWSPVALCVTRRHVVVACNRAFAELFGYDDSTSTIYLEKPEPEAVRAG